VTEPIPRTSGGDSTRVPVVLFACVHNSGRSVAAQLLAAHYAGPRLDVRSAGSEPADGVNAQVAAVLTERGLDPSGHIPRLLDGQSVRAADIVITMGCGETCPVFPGTRYEDWNVTDPENQDRDTVRAIIDDIDARVRALVCRLSRT